MSTLSTKGKGLEWTFAIALLTPVELVQRRQSHTDERSELLPHNFVACGTTVLHGFWACSFIYHVVMVICSVLIGHFSAGSDWK